MGKFGDTLRIVIKKSGLKYALISQRINFDPSYISKWINSDLLPSPKIIESICEEISKLSLEHLDEKDLQLLCKDLNIDCIENVNLSYDLLYNKIYGDYMFDHNTRNTTESSSLVFNPNSQYDIVSDNRNLILEKIAEYRKISDSISISILGEILCCSPEDIIFFMDIRSEIIKQDFKNVVFQVFISESSITDCDKERTGVALINFFMVPCNWNISYYSIKTFSSGIIISIKNLLMFSSQLSYNNSWLLNTCTYQKDQINNFHKLIANDIVPISRIIFESYDETSINYSQSMLKVFSLRHDIALAGILDTFFLTDELLDLFLSMITISSEESILWSKNHRINQDRIRNEEEINYIFYRDAFDKLVYKGRIRIFGRELILPIELRLQVLECINKNLDNYPNIKIKVVDSYLVDEIKHDPLPNIYASSIGSYFLTSPINGKYKYCCVKNKKYVNYLNKILHNIWEENNIPLLSGNTVVEEYLSICQEILLFELI